MKTGDLSTVCAMVIAMRVKICGITTLPDAIAAVRAGADALGFMFYEQSSRRLSIEAAAAIARELPPFVAKVGVFVDPARESVKEAIAKCHLSAVQLHGTESPDFCCSLDAAVIKAFRMQGPASLDQLVNYPTSAWLLDSYVPNQPGGTGERFNWELAVKAKAFGRPIVLAGGLTPENVASAVEQVQPYGVDVSSGVESAPGKKDAGKMRAFVAAAKCASSH